MLGLLNVRIARSVVLVIALALSVTALSDMLNYSPDALYRVGSSAVGMFNSPSAPTGIVRPVRHDGPSPAPSAGQPSSEPSRTPQPAPTFPPGPTTPGSIDTVSLPAFWTGDPLATATVSVYLPGDYGSGGGPYPVVYTAPWVYDSWERAVHVRELLDGMIAAGEIPPTIVVFAGLGGGPYADTECVNSYDGRSEAETYLAVTVPSWIDSHYRTIRDAQHRTIMGFSEGAYCAAMLLLGHPDVFHEGICFGGYYTAGIRGPQT